MRMPNLLLIVLLLIPTIGAANMQLKSIRPASLLSQADEDPVIKLDKKLRYNTVDEAKHALTGKLLMPPTALGIKRDEVHRRLGMPKETFGYGNEVYHIKDANLVISYTTNENGDTVVNSVEYRPKQEQVWTEWLKPPVDLPKPANYDSRSKIAVQITTRIRIEDFGENKSLQITLIGSPTRVSFVNWSLVL